MAAAQQVGKLMWGQAGEYDAVDDRLALSVAMQGTPGLWCPPVLTRVPNQLQVSIDKFAAGIMVGDGTLAVCARWEPMTFNFPAGGSSRVQYEIWLTADVEAAEWSISVENAEEAYATQMLGIALGSVFVNPNANTSAEFDLWRALSSMGSIRNYRRDWERLYFEQQNPYRAWGSLTGLDETQSLDVLWNNEYYTMFWGGDPRSFIQSGYVSAACNANGDVYVGFPIPYTNNDVHIQITPTAPLPIWIPPGSVNASGFWARYGTGNFLPQPQGTNGAFSWLARGIRRTGGV